MPDENANSCPSCGAHLSEGAEVCDLCGTPADEVASQESAADIADADPSPVGTEAESDGVFCNQCGWKNPPDARFCSQCGTELQDVASAVRPATPPPASASAAGAAAVEPQRDSEGSGVGRQIGILVGAGVLLVIALFLVDVVSSGQSSSPEESSSDRAGVPAADGAVVTEAPDPEAVLGQVETEPLPPQLADQAAALEDEIDGLDETAGAARRLELVNLYAGAGRFGQAAVEQRKVAEQQDTFDAWRRAGNLFYEWMDGVQGAAKTDVAELAVDAYQRALSLKPEDTDVRTDMATAYLNTSSPMRGVQEINQVLAEDPEHVQANFNYGYMLMLINRLDQAEEQFIRVQELVGPESRYYEQASELLEIVRQQGSGSTSS